MNPRAKQFLWISGAGVAVTAMLVLFCFDPANVRIYPAGAFHAVTGMDCPGCGSLRAMHQLLHGHLATAMRLNPLAVLSVPFLGWLAGRFLWQQLKGGSNLVVRPLWLRLYLAA